MKKSFKGNFLSLVFLALLQPYGFFSSTSTQQILINLALFSLEIAKLQAKSIFIVVFL